MPQHIKKLPKEVTFKVGAPPPTPQRPRRQPTASAFQIAILGLIVVMAVVTIGLGHLSQTGGPAATTTTSQTAAP